MKTCVTTYSYHHYFDDNQLGYLGVIDKTKEIGFDGIEFIGRPNLEARPETAKEIKERCAEVGLEVVSYTVGADFINGSNGDLKDEIARLCKIIDYAAELGAPRLRHDATGGFKDGRTCCRGYDDALPRLIQGCREVTKYAEQKGIKTMTENHGGFSQDANRVEKLINGVASPNFGALVDIGNFMCADEDPNVSVGIMAPYAFHVHAKDFYWKSGNEINPGAGWFRTRAGNYLRGSIIGHGAARAYQSLQILKRSGYDGYVSVEFEGAEDPLVGIQMGLDNIKRFIAD